MSDDFIVGLRMAVDQRLTGGLGPEDMIEIARSLTSSGAVDLISVSGGTGATRLATAYFVPGDELPEGVYNEQAARFRQAVGVPVLVAGRNVEPEVAEAGLAAGVDLVAMTRAIIADPDLPLKVAAGERKRPCISLNEGCIGRLYTGLPMWCSVNPAIREPELARLTPAVDPGRVVVVGAASRAWRRPAPRRCAVTTFVVFERRPDLGGRARLAAERRGRERWRLYVDWLRDEAVDAGVEIRLGASADVATVLAEQPDAVILATGSRLRDVAPPPETPMLDVDTLLERGLPAGVISRALVLDDEGGFLAPTAAEALVAAGCSVEIATTHTSVAALVDPTQQPFVLRRLALAGVVQSPNLEWVPGSGPGSSCDTSTPSRSNIEPTPISSSSRAVGRARPACGMRLRTEAPGLPGDSGRRCPGAAHAARCRGRRCPGRQDHRDRPAGSDPGSDRWSGVRPGRRLTIGLVVDPSRP